MIDEGIIAIVKADLTLIQMLGGRIYPHQIIQGNDYPMASLQVVEQPPISGQGGICLREYDFLIAISSNNYSECRAIGERLIVVFNKYSGAKGNLNVVMCKYTGTPLNTLQNDTNLYYIAYEFNILINI